jgi:hypothetical protein
LDIDRTGVAPNFRPWGRILLVTACLASRAADPKEEKKMIMEFLDRLEREAMVLVDSVDQDPLVGGVIRGSATRDDYVRFLTSSYHYVRWSGTLLAETAHGVRRRGRHSWLAELLEAKSREESPHDGWILHDLASCGADLERVKSAEAPVSVDAYVHWSLTMADAGSPAYLGAAYALEFLSSRRATLAARNLCDRGRIANIRDGVSFLAGHGDADGDHVATMETVLRRVDDRSDQVAIALSASVLRALYPRFFHAAAPAATLRRCA